MNKQLKMIKEKIQYLQPFALARFGDGEKAILHNIPCNRKGFKFDPEKDQKFRMNLIKALKLKMKDYFVGISRKPELFSWYQNMVQSQSLDAALFINENYLDFINKIVPLFQTRDIILVCNKKAKFENLPFKCEKIHYISDNAWKNDIWDNLFFDLVWALDTKIVLVAGGPYSCTLIAELWKDLPYHLFIDIGSALDPYLYGKKTRKYHERLNDVS